MSLVLLDTDVCIWHLRGRKEVSSLLRKLLENDLLAVSAIARAEIQQGVRPGEEAATTAFLDACQTLPATAAIADEAGRLVREVRAAGRTVHLPDALIAATALVHSAPLYTCNARHYPFEGLHVRTVSL